MQVSSFRTSRSLQNFILFKALLFIYLFQYRITGQGMYYLQYKINYFRNIYKLEIQNQILIVAFKLQPNAHVGRQAGHSYIRQYCLMSLWLEKSFWVLDFHVTKCVVTVLHFRCTQGGFHQVDFSLIMLLCECLLTFSS